MRQDKTEKRKVEPVIGPGGVLFFKKNKRKNIDNFDVLYYVMLCSML